MSMTGNESQADSDIKADAKSSLISVTRHRDKDLLTTKCGEFDSLTCSKAGKEENFSLITCLVDEDKFLHGSSKVIDNAILTQAFCFMLFTFASCAPFLRDVQGLFISANLALSLLK